MIDATITFGLLASGYLISAQLEQGRRALYLAPLISMILCLLSAILHVLLDFEIVLVWASAMVLAASLTTAVRGSRARLTRGLKSLLSEAGRWQLLIFSLFQVVSWISTPAPLLWDARSIWFAHANWLRGPASYFLEAQFLPAGPWPDYPLAGPALMAVGQEIGGGSENLWLASRLMGAVFISAIFLIFDKLAASTESMVRVGWQVAFLTAFATASMTIANSWFNTGYQDSIQAALVCLTFVYALFLGKEVGWREPTLVLLFFTLASNIKQEGFWFSTVALLVALIMGPAKRPVWILIILAGAFTTRIMWNLFQSWTGMPENYHTSDVISRLPTVFGGEQWIWTSFLQVLSEGFGLKFVILAFSSLLVLLISLFMNARGLGQVMAHSSWVTAAMGLALVLLFTYVLGESQDLTWWLGTSFSRVSASLEMLVYCHLIWSAMSILGSSKHFSKSRRNQPSL